jgi:hypothetical protein
VEVVQLPNLRLRRLQELALLFERLVGEVEFSGSASLHNNNNNVINARISRL